MVEKDSTEIEFVKNFRVNNEWKRVALSKAEVKAVQLQHIRDLMTLWTNVCFEVRDSDISVGLKLGLEKTIFEAVAQKGFTVIQSALDRKILNHRENSKNGKL